MNGIYYSLFVLILLPPWVLSCVEYDVKGRKHYLCEGKSNPRTTIPDDIPAGTNVLIIRDHNITSIPVDAFKNLKELNSLILESSNVITIHMHAFLGLGKLEKLSLRNNLLTFGLSGLPEKIFQSLGNLTELDLSQNPLGKIKWEHFKGIRFNALKTLNLSGIKGSQPLTLVRNVLSGFKNLQVLNMSYTGLKRIDMESEISEMKNLRLLLIQGNPLICDCKLLWLKKYLSENGQLMLHEESKNRKLQDINPPTCQDPEIFRGHYPFFGPDPFKMEKVMEEVKFGCPPEMLTNSTSLNAYEYSEVSMFCNVTSENRGTSQWYKDDVEIPDDDEKYSISTHQNGKDYRMILKISQIQLTDLGVYRCNFTNEFGSSFAEFNATVLPKPYAAFNSNQTVLLVTLIICICLAILTILIFLFRFKRHYLFENPFRTHKKFCVELGQSHCYRRKENSSNKEAENLITEVKPSIFNPGLCEDKSDTFSPNSLILSPKMVSNKLNDCLYVSCDGPEPKIYLNTESLNSKSPQLLPQPTSRTMVITSPTTKNSVYAKISNPSSVKKPCPLHGDKLRGSMELGSIQRESTMSPNKSCPVHGKDSSNQKGELKLKSSLKSPKSMNSISSSSTLPSKHRAKIVMDNEKPVATLDRKTKNGVIFKSIVELTSSSCQEFSSQSSVNSNKTVSSLTDSTESFGDKKHEKDYEFYLDRLSKHSQMSISNLNNNSDTSSLRRRSSITNVNFKPNLYPVDNGNISNTIKSNLNGSSACLIGTQIVISDKNQNMRKTSSNGNLSTSRQSLNSSNCLLRAGSKHKLDDPYESEHSSVD